MKKLSLLPLYSIRNDFWFYTRIILSLMILPLFMGGCATTPVVIPGGNVPPQVMYIERNVGTGIRFACTLEVFYTMRKDGHSFHQVSFLPLYEEHEIPPACLMDSEEDKTQCIQSLKIKLQVLENPNNLPYSLWVDWKINHGGDGSIYHSRELISDEGLSEGGLYAGYFEKECPIGREGDGTSIDRGEAKVEGKIVFKNEEGKELFSIWPLRYKIRERE